MQKCENLIRWLSSLLSNSDESKTDAASNELPDREMTIGKCCRMRKATSDTRWFHSLPVPAVLGIPFVYCRDLYSQKISQVISRYKASILQYA